MDTPPPITTDNYADLIPAHFAPEGRVWIFAAAHTLPITKAVAIGDHLRKFVHAWKSHDIALNADCHIFFGRFLVVFTHADLTPSGCATDALFREIAALDPDGHLGFLNRHIISVLQKGHIEAVPFEQLLHACAHNMLDKNAKFFDNNVATVGDFATRWIVPIKDSWITRRAGASTTL